MYWIPIRKKCGGRLAYQYYPIALPFFEEIGSCHSYFQIHMLYFIPLSVNEISLHCCKSNIRLKLVESLVIVIFYVFFYVLRPQNLRVTIGPLPYCFPWVLLRWTIFHYPTPPLKISFVRFSFSPFCVKATIPSSSFISLWFISFFAKACFSLCKNITKLYSLVRRPHSFGLYSHSGIKYFNSLITNVFIKLL